MHITRLLQSALGALTLALITPQAAHAVVEAGHWSSNTNTSSSLPEVNFSVYVDQTVGGDYTGTFLNYTAGKLKGITLNIDEGSALYIVKPGDVFTQASSKLALAVPFSALPATVGSDFYLAAKTRSQSDPGFNWSDPEFYVTFGWAHFKVDGLGKLQLLDSAMAFREGGIVVGSLQAVPEPASGALMGLGLVGMVWRVRAKHRGAPLRPRSPR